MTAATNIDIAVQNSINKSIWITRQLRRNNNTTNRNAQHTTQILEAAVFRIPTTVAVAALN